ncbi:hypothetical protein M9458_024702, partial [Cirrhinus mrigala]
CAGITISSAGIKWGRRRSPETISAAPLRAMTQRRLSLPLAHYRRQLNPLSPSRQRERVKSPAYLSLCYLSPARALPAYA